MYCCPEEFVKFANAGPRLFVFVQVGGDDEKPEEGNGTVVELKAQGTALSKLRIPPRLILNTVCPLTVDPFDSPTESALASLAPTVRAKITKPSKR
jgi:hypothetical protein